jgi:hypothetical protein
MKQKTGFCPSDLKEQNSLIMEAMFIAKHIALAS